MLKACEQAVDKLGISPGKIAGLYALYTALLRYLTNQVFFVRSLCTKLEQLMSAYRHPKLGIYNLLGFKLYPLSTVPINNTNLN